MHRAAVQELVRHLVDSGAGLAYLVDAVTEHSVDLLDELQQSIEQKRRTLDEEFRTV